jgi:two-component system, sensor histidine kinase and response regulator
MDLLRQSAPVFDLVIAQVVEQGEDGVALAEQFQTSRPAGSASPFIAMTDASEHTTRSALENMGLYCAGILENPIDRLKLHNLIFAILSQDSEANDPANPRNASLASLQGKHILLVEDNDLNQELIRELVESVGVEVTIAHNGAHALEVLSGRAPSAMFDLVLMDCNMPVMDGFQATQAIRKTPALAHLPIIALTANAIKGTRELVINSGMNDYLTKPLEIDKFYAAMQKWSTQSTRPAQSERLSLPGGLPNTSPTAPTANVQLSVALGNCMGNRTLLARMMGLFVKNEADFAGKFEAAQAAHDATTMIRLAHTLKGGAETMGAMQLAAAAADLEAGCKEGADGEVLSQQRETTVEKLKIALHELTNLQKSLSAPA